MALDATAREANLRDSIKKFFYTNLPSNVVYTFDRGLAHPDLQDKSTDQWVAINFGNDDPGSVYVSFLLIYVCSRNDPEGYKLAQLSDKVITVLSNTTYTDGMQRIPLYRSTTADHSTWSQVGSILVVDFYKGNQLQMEDETKYRLITVKLTWAAKV